MGILGESFPDSEKEKYIQRNFVPGCVIHLFAEFIFRPKEKFILVASSAQTPVLFVINTQITNFVKARPHLLNCQILLEAKDHPFLDHDSFLDCGTAYTPYSQEELREILLADVTKLRGELTDPIIAQVKKVVSQAKTIAPKHKNEILGSL